jgi:hypothetical protein
MIAVLCKISTNDIIGIVDNVKSISNNEIVGQNSYIKGINLDEANFKVLDYEVIIVQENKEFPEFITPEPTEENLFPSPELVMVEKPVDVVKFKKNEVLFGVGDIFDLSLEIDKKDLLEKSELELLKKENAELKLDGLNMAEILLDLGIRLEMLEMGV